MNMTREQFHATPSATPVGGDDSKNPGEATASRFAWQVIDEARHRGVTGELCLTTASPSKIRVYLDSGVVYFAERETDESLATRLVLAGAIDPDQLHRGSLRLNGVEHLGRLFDRDASVGRDEVELALELMTEQTLTEIAEHEILSSQISMYRHHSSGVVRWFANRSTAQTDLGSRDDEVGLRVELCSWQPPSTAPVDTAPPRSVSVPDDADTDGLPENGLFDDNFGAAQTNNTALPTLPDKPISYASRAIQPPSNRLIDRVAGLVVTPVVMPVVASAPDAPGTSTDALADSVNPATETLPTIPGQVTPLISIKGLVPLTSTPSAAGPDVAVEQAPALTKLTPISGLKLTPISGQVKMVSGAVPVTASGHQELLDSHDASTPVPEDVAAAVRRAITAIEAATQGGNRVEPMDFTTVHVTSPALSPITAPRPGLVSLSGPNSGLVPLTSASPTPSDISGLITGEQPVLSDTDPIESLHPIVTPPTVAPVLHAPVIEAFVGSGRLVATPGVNEVRRNALQRLIDGVRRR